MPNRIPRPWFRAASLLTGSFILLASIPARAAEPAENPPSPDWEPALRASLETMAATLTDTLKPWPVPDRSFRVQDYGAKPDGITLNTASLQRAIDACSASGGGVVLFSGGDFLTGTIELKTGVMLRIDKDTRILGSIHLADYPDKIPAHKTHATERKCLIYAENCDRIGIRGDGAIDGQGTAKNFPAIQGKPIPERPYLIRMIECRNVVVDSIHLRNSASWMQDYLNCDNLIFHNVNVENQVNWNEDGFDIDGCHDVIVRDCFVNSYDDGICFKGEGQRTMENVLVENCTVYSECNGLKFGTASVGGFRNVLVRNIKISQTPENLPALHRRLCESAISWESVDGGAVENILVTHAEIHRVDSPIFLRVGNRVHPSADNPNPPPGKLRRLIFDHITGDQISPLGSIIAGMPGSPIQDVLIRDMEISVAGGGQPNHEKIPEDIAKYPNSTMFGPDLPAYGFWLRHASAITFQNIQITPNTPDPRPCFKADEDTQAILLDGKSVNSPG